MKAVAVHSGRLLRNEQQLGTTGLSEHIGFGLQGAGLWRAQRESEPWFRELPRLRAGFQSKQGNESGGQRKVEVERKISPWSPQYKYCVR